MDRMVVRPLPIGLAYLAAHVDEAQHDLEVLDLMFSSDAVSDVNEAVRRFEPDLVGLSIRNLDNQSFLNPISHLPAVASDRWATQRWSAAGPPSASCPRSAFGTSAPTWGSRETASSRSLSW